MKKQYLMAAVNAKARLSNTNPAMGITRIGISGLILFSADTTIASFHKENICNSYKFYYHSIFTLKFIKSLLTDKESL
ncbi:hypothetical protein [Gudongella sp. DL1XJH-153]|uniref:hypothetical protein n=1 Tax=Gudongella sp. DL1XJH-153 TaxID=3409804 RepID=UPI003BB5980D